MPKTVGVNEYVQLAERLKSARISAGLTQREAALKFKQAQARISEIENGERRVDIIELKKLAQIYKKDISYFL